MQYYIQSVHIKLSYFTIKLQSNTHLTYYSYNIQQDLKLNLGRASGGQLIEIGYWLKVPTEPMENNRVLADRIGKRGNHLHSIRKSSDFCLEEKMVETVSVYKQKRLADLSSPWGKSADMGRNVKGTVLQG
jgi:hypothetical protein